MENESKNIKKESGCLKETKKNPVEPEMLNYNNGEYIGPHTYTSEKMANAHDSECREQ